MDILDHMGWVNYQKLVFILEVNLSFNIVLYITMPIPLRVVMTELYLTPVWWQKRYLLHRFNIQSPHWPPDDCTLEVS